MKTSSCCGRGTTAPLPLRSKLGHCKVCMALSLLGLLVSYFLLTVILVMGGMPVFVIAFFVLLAAGFTVLCVLHGVAYRRKINANGFLPYRRTKTSR